MKIKWIYLIDQYHCELVKFQATVDQAIAAVIAAGKTTTIKRENEHQAVIIVW